MSTILKALRQLENETPPDSVDPFGAVVEPDPTSTPARTAKPKRRGAAGMALGIGLASAGLLLIGLALQPMFRTSTPSVVVAAASQGTAPVAEVSVAPTAPALAAPPSKPVMPRASVAILSQPEPAVPDAAEVEPQLAAPDAAEVPIAVVAAVSEEPVQQLAERFAAANAPETPAVAAPVAVAEARPGPGASGEIAAAFIPATAEAAKTAEVSVAAPAQKPAVLAAAEPAPAAVSTPPKVEPAAPEVAAKPAPKAAEVVLDRAAPDFEKIRRPLDPPVLFPVQTSWHPKAERREARLEAVSGQAQVVREGDEVDGYTVLEISPSAVVFERGGETVRVRVGGS